MAQAVRVWQAGQDLADEMDLRAHYASDAAHARNLRRAAILLRGL